MPQQHSTHRWTHRSTVLVLAGAAIALGACATPEGSADDSGSSESAPAQVRFALDWAPNTNHVGVYVADELGYFADAGLEVTIVPYASTPALQLVSAGEADFGIAGQASVQMGRTSGLDVISVYRVTQQDVGRLVVLGDRADVTRPADLDGLTFGGFGAPLYTALAQATISGDGGAGEFTEVMLDTGAYEALSQGRIDFTLSVETWENVQADLDGHPYQEFSYQDFGVPDQQAVGIASSDAYLAESPEEAQAFVQAVARGYQYAAEHPAEAADLLIAAHPDTLGTAQDLVHASLEILARDGYLVSSERPIGAADPQAWEEFGSFLFSGGFLTDSGGAPLTVEPDWSQHYTDDLL